MKQVFRRFAEPQKPGTVQGFSDFAIVFVKLSLLGSPGSINHKGRTTGGTAVPVNSTIPRLTKGPLDTTEMQVQPGSKMPAKLT